MVSWVTLGYLADSDAPRPEQSGYKAWQLPNAVLGISELPHTEAVIID